jgi:hypothetical protein
VPAVEYQSSDRPRYWITEDQNNRGVTLAIIGFRLENNTPVPIRVRITYGTGPNPTVLDWWTPLGRTNDVIQVGDSVVSAPFKVAAGQTDSFAFSVGEA